MIAYLVNLIDLHHGANKVLQLLEIHMTVEEGFRKDACLHS